jgi:hypothetical protein
MKNNTNDGVYDDGVMMTDNNYVVLFLSMVVPLLLLYCLFEFHDLITSSNKNDIVKLCKYMKEAFVIRNSFIK